MGYVLGVDLGTTYTAAATWDPDEGAARMLGLGNRALQIPSVLYRQGDGAFLVGEPAERRGISDPANVVREFKRRIGDHVPIVIGTTPYSPQSLTAKLLRWVVDLATERIGSPPDFITLTHPANWGNFKIDLLMQAAALADLDNVTTCSEPEAAARQYAAANTVSEGDLLCVYDLGGGTFDAAVLVSTASGFRTIGNPEGIEHLGGIDFDQAILRLVLDAIQGDSTDLDLTSPTELNALARLRRDCTEAKEALSTDVDAIIDITIGPRPVTVRLTRAEFEDMIRPALQDTVGCTSRALRSANVKPADLTTFVLVGGSSRIPLVTETLTSTFRRPVARNTHPKHDIALGAARTLPDPARQQQGHRGPMTPLPVPQGRQTTNPPSPVTQPWIPPTSPSVQPSAALPLAAEPRSLPHVEAEQLPTEVIHVDTTNGGQERAQEAATQPDSLSQDPPRPAPPGGAPHAYRYAQPPADRDQFPSAPQASAEFGPAGAQAPHGAGPDPDPRIPGVPVGPNATDSSQRKRLLLIGSAAAIVVAIVVGVVFFIQRSSQNNPSAGTAAQSTSSAVPLSSSQQVTSAPTSSPPTSPSVLPLTVDIPQGPTMSDETVVAQRTVNDKGVLFLIDASTGAVTDQLGGVVGAVPAISPDRRSILYLSTNDQKNTALRVVGSDGEGDRWLFTTPPTGCERMFRPAWNPMDPNEIAAACYNADKTKYTLNILGLDGSIRRTLNVGQDAIDDPSWSPDGKTLTFWAGPNTPLVGGAIYTMAADGTTPPVQLTDGTGSDTDPMFSPDGKEIVFRRWNFDVTGKNTDVDIVVMSSDGSNVRVLAKHPGNDRDPAWSPDGTQIVWKSNRAVGDAIGTDQYWVMDADGQNIHRLNPEDGAVEQSAPAWGRR